MVTYDETNIMTPWNETRSVLLALCDGNPPVPAGFPSQRFNNTDVFFVVSCWPR